MRPSSETGLLGHEFDGFLYATLGPERDGPQLTLVSMLAQMNLDPWQVAADLADRPVAAAERRLATMIRSIPDWTATHPETDIVTAKLIALLHQKPRTQGPRAADQSPAEDSFVPKRLTKKSILLAALLLVILIAGFELAHRMAADTAAPGQSEQQVTR
ncbi:MAG TPA: hypothetical protein VGM84_13110 [Steroidobacteraceae bacterium]|jgi:hypothetical protein